MPPRKLVTITGLLWIATFITSIPAVLLYDPLLNNEDFILGAGGGDTRIFVRATLELLLIIANIGTAVVPFAPFRRYDERLALGYVTARLVECGFIAVSIVRARRRPRRDLLLGPGFVVGVGDGLILGYLMYTSASPERESRRRSGRGAGDRRPLIDGPDA